MSAEIVLRRVELRLTHAHRAAHGTVTTRPTLIVEFRTTADVEVRSGWGECPALPQPGYSNEYTDGAQAVLTDVLQRRPDARTARDAERQARKARCEDCALAPDCPSAAPA